MRLLHGDCLTILPTLSECSVDSVICDPPYHLTTGKSVGFMGMKWDGGNVAMRPETWATVLRVAKPGAYLLAFGGTRTHHRMMCAIEDAGWDLRDTIMWIYGSGFPKSTTALKPAFEPIILARKPLQGTLAANYARWGTGGLDIDGCRIPATGDYGRSAANADGRRVAGAGVTFATPERGADYASPLGRWPANIIHDGSDDVMALFPQSVGQAGAVTGTEPSAKTCNTFGVYNNRPAAEPRGDAGSAARFFYCAKASPSDRGTGNTHPTVKPTALMRYLCRLVTPAGGTVLDPFAGSGSTLKAAALEGYGGIGIELNADYLAIATARCSAIETLPNPD